MGDPSAPASAPYEVWANNRKLNSGGSADKRVPASCCLVTGTGGQTSDCASKSVAEESEIYVSDCFENVASFTQGHVQMLAVCCVVFGLVLVATAVLAICLFHVVD